MDSLKSFQGIMNIVNHTESLKLVDCRSQGLFKEKFEKGMGPF